MAPSFWSICKYLKYDRSGWHLVHLSCNSHFANKDDVLLNSYLAVSSMKCLLIKIIPSITFTYFIELKLIYNVILISVIQHNNLIFAYSTKWSPQSLVTIHHHAIYALNLFIYPQHLSPLIFWGTLILFSKVADPIYIPSSVQEFPFLYNLCRT